MNNAQTLALREHCRLAGETVHPRFATLVRIDGVPKVSIVLTVNSGYE